MTIDQALRLYAEHHTRNIIVLHSVSGVQYTLNADPVEYCKLYGDDCVYGDAVTPNPSRTHNTRWFNLRFVNFVKATTP